MQRFKNILVVSNEEGLSDAALARAKWLAQANDAKLTLFSVKKTGGMDLAWLMLRLQGQGTEDLTAQLDSARKDTLDRVAAMLASDGTPVDTLIAEGVPFVETIRQVMTGGHDLVLKGAEQSFDWRTLGGPDLHLLRKCPCPVWILNSGSEPSAKRILAAVDPDPEDPTRDALNNKVMQLATSLAVQDGAHVDVLNAWFLEEEHLLRGSRVGATTEEVDALVEATRSQSRARLDQLIAKYDGIVPGMNAFHIKGVAADVIVHHTEQHQIDTLIMGTVGRVGLSGMFIGNTAETVLNRVKCSVLAVKPENFISPVEL